MRQIDETNSEHDRVKKVEVDLNKKLTAFIERINVKISSLEAKVGTLMAPQPHKRDVMGRYDPFDTPCSEEGSVPHYSVYGLGSVFYIKDKSREIIEITFDKRGVLYTLATLNKFKNDGLGDQSFLDTITLTESELINSKH